MQAMVESQLQVVHLADQMAQGNLTIQVTPRSDKDDFMRVITSYSIHYTKLYEARERSITSTLPC